MPVAKTLKNYIAWHKAPEDRPWKIKVQVIELATLIFVSIVSVAGFAIHGEPKRFEEAFYLFAGGLLLSEFALVAFFSTPGSASRFVRGAVLLALAAGNGLLAGFGFVILTSIPAAT